MANNVEILYQKTQTNFKTTVFQVNLTGSYAGPEVVSLTAGSASNPSGQTVTGPNGFSELPPRVTGVNVGGTAANGYVAKLVATSTAGQYDLTLAYGSTAFSGAYTAGDNVIIEVDHQTQNAL